MRVDIALLGGFHVRIEGSRVEDDAWERRQAAQLVKLLALASSRQLHREQCLDALWPDVGVAEAAPRLHKAAHYARKALGDRDAIVLRHDIVSLFPNAEVTIDLIEFERLAASALRETSADAIEMALGRYGGRLLPGDPYDEWITTRREHAHHVYIELLRRGQQWPALLAEEPADEDAHLALMRAHIATGDRHSALRQYERMDRALRDELGMAPSATATSLRDEILEALPHSVPIAPVAVRDDLVGRAREVEALGDALTRAGEGRGRAVLLSGPPGVGKTALFEHLRAEAAALGWRCGVGVAAAIEGAWPYAPVLEAIAELVRTHPTLLDGLDDAYRAEIDRARRGDDDVWTSERADGPRGIARGDDRLGAPRPLGHQRLFIATAELLRLAASGPGVLLVIDDAHDADDASLRLLHYLARHASSERALIAIACRSSTDSPRLEEMRASLQQRSALTDISVSPLDIEATRALVTRFRPSATDTAVREIATVAGGVPFAIIELARRDDDQLDASAVGGVDTATRLVLQRVAIAGMTFDTDGFIALSGLSDDVAFVHLDAALAAHVVERIDVGYRFRHALVRDALLADVPMHRQRQIHRDAAQRLGVLGASPARIGHHLLHAGDAAAVPYLLRAAETEAALGAYRDALALLDAARPHARGVEIARVSTLRGDLLFALGDTGAIAAYREAYALNAGTDRRLVQAKLGRAALFSGDVALAEATLRGLETAGDDADSTIMLAKANHAFFSGDIETATRLADDARELIQGDATNWQLLDLIALQGLLAHNKGEWFEQLRIELKRTLHTPNLANAVFDGHLCVAEYLLYGPVPYSEVLELAEALHTTATRAGALRAVAFAAALAGEAALLAGDLERADRELQEAVDLHREIGATAGEAHSLQRLAELRVAQGDHRAARALLDRALPLARWSPIALHLLQRIYGTMIAAAPSTAEARAVVDVAAAALGADDFCPFCQIMYEVPAAIACANVGDLDDAREHFAVAERSALLWHGTAWRAATLEARAYIARAEGCVTDAEKLLARAGIEFERAGQPIDASRCTAGLSVGRSA